MRCCFLAQSLWPKYAEPVRQKRLKSSDTAELQSAFNVHAKDVKDYFYHHDVHSDQVPQHNENNDANSGATGVGARGGTSTTVVSRGSSRTSRVSMMSLQQKVDLPYHGKLLLLACFLGSYNDQAQDRALFGSASGKGLRAKRKKGLKLKGGATKGAGAQAATQVLKGPKSFELERLIWLYRAMSTALDVIVVGTGRKGGAGGSTVTSLNEGVYRQIPALIQLGLLLRETREDQLNGIKYKCVAPKDYAERVAHELQFSLDRYLVSD